jgi:PAS domain S-box-containing protein
VRQTVTFAVQNLVRDPPIARVDLISCRNLLIYLEPDAQKKVIALLHFALNEGGFLFLGPSETVGRQTDRFEPVSKKWRIYRRLGPTRRERLDFPVAATARGTSHPPVEGAGARRVSYTQLTQRLLLEQFAPAAVLINRRSEVLYYFGPYAHYLEFPPGEPTHSLLLLAREGLRTKLRGAVRRAVLANERTVLTDVRVKRDGGYYPVRVTVLPVQVPEAPEGLLLVTFEGAPLVPPAPPLAAAAEGGEAGGQAALRQAEDELRATREELRSAIEDRESSGAELTALNEGVMSANEELQSANEELRTSKEELQSLNEELRAVNIQLEEKVGELEKANDDMANLLNSTDVATVFLDRGQRVKLFTPSTRRLFSLMAADVGRPLRDIAPKVTDPDLERDAGDVLRDLAPREREVRTEDGHWYLRRVLPYRTRDDRIDGVVMVFVDITDREQKDAAVRRLAAIVESSADAIFSKDLDGTIRTWNRGAERLYGYTRDEAVGRSVEMLFPEDRAQEFATIMTRLRRGEAVEHLETERVRKDGRRVTVALTVSPIRAGNGEVVSASVTGRDITERKRAEEALREKEERLRQMMDNAHVGIAFGDSQGRVVRANRTMMQLVGWSEDDLHAGRLHCGALCRPEDHEHDRWAMTQLATVGRVGPAEKTLIRTDGAQIPVLISALRLDVNGDENVTFVVDLTPQKKVEAALRDREERLRAILNTVAEAIITIDRAGAIQSVNRAAEQMFGYAAAEMLGQNVSMLMASPHREAHDGYLARYLQTGEKHVIGTTREVEARRKDARVFPTELAVSEVEPLGLFTGVHRDLTERKQLERDVVEAASLEQRRIGQDLHDSVAQELAALDLLTGDLAEALRSDPASAAPLVGQITRGLQRSQRELRAVLRGLLPVAVDSAGLMAALSDLADRTRQEGKVSCTFDCPEPVSVPDNLVATQLYFIAQEAVHNAVKHARAREVRVALNREDAGLVLRVEDDGIGMPAPATGSKGLGLRIMRDRAGILGARLTLSPAVPAGTVVTCAWTRTSHEQEKGREAGPGPDRG